MQSEIFKMYEILGCRCLSNAGIEGMFSTRSLVKTQLRNRLSIGILNMLMSIKFNSPNKSEWKYQNYVDLCKEFLETKKRRKGHKNTKKIKEESKEL